MDAGFCVCVWVLIKIEIMMTALFRERSNGVTDSPQSDAFRVLCWIKLSWKKKHLITSKLSIKISCSSEDTFYKIWMRNDAEQTESLCIVIHGLIAVFFNASLLVRVCLRKGSNAPVLGHKHGCNSRRNLGRHAFFERSSKRWCILLVRWSVQVNPWVSWFLRTCLRAFVRFMRQLP